jgi:hypothetical protein
MYTNNTYDTTLDWRLFEIHNDGAYISHALTGTNWIKLQEITSNDNTLYGLYNCGIQAINYHSSTNYWQYGGSGTDIEPLEDITGIITPKINVNDFSNSNVEPKQTNMQMLIYFLILK